MFDCTRKITYKNLPKWLKELREYRPEIPCFCVANKIDSKHLSHQVELVVVVVVVVQSCQCCLLLLALLIFAPAAGNRLPC